MTGSKTHSAPTEVIALENTLYGVIFPQDEIIRISAYAHSICIKMHLDGARLWHVAAETGRSVGELCEPFDSISLCFSKGLGKIAVNLQCVIYPFVTFRCPRRFLFSRYEGVYSKGPSVQETVRRWHAPDWDSRCFCRICLDTQFSATPSRTCFGKKTRGWIGGNWCHDYKQGRNVYGRTLYFFGAALGTNQT